MREMRLGKREIHDREILREILEECDVAVEMDCCHKIITRDYTCSYSYAYCTLWETEGFAG